MLKQDSGGDSLPNYAGFLIAHLVAIAAIIIWQLLLISGP
jgi:hypothetical protein|tara:strand:+ start:1275 stop:1394 length:120 start_codon:yes stop_codon:yes gene_type:complete